MNLLRASACCFNGKVFLPAFAAILFLALPACERKPYESVESTWPDGSPQVIKYYKSEDVKVLLREVHYYENGQKRMEGSFKNDKRDGEWNAWYQDGTSWSRGYYKEGREHGLKTVWYENGQKYYEGEVVYDERVGVWRFWEKNGELIKEVNYDK